MRMVLLIPMLLVVLSTLNAHAQDAPNRKPWRAVHLLSLAPRDVPLMKRAVEEVLAPVGVNVIILEVDYSFEFASHPELRAGGGLTKAQARELAATCRKHGIRLIPQFNCLGHQSWAKSTAPLLTKYPELDETPDVPKDNKGIYCRSWCPLHPKVNPIVFALMDELVDAFEADAIHVGMDEVFLIASDQCPRCRGKSPADLFAKAVNDYHAHFAPKTVEMLMWGDRFLDDSVMKYSEWDASRNGTAPAVDKVPKDIIMCDWHYKKRDAWPSVPFFQQKGFRVLPSSWKDKEAALAFLDYARANDAGRMLGHLSTTWVGAGQLLRALLPDQDKSKLPPDALLAADALKACMAELNVKGEK